MSYLEYFCNNIEKKTCLEQIRGTCHTMCPQQEVESRVKEKMVHILEVNGNEQRLVKSYRRSAADCNLAIPRLLRPYSVLKDTVHYLILNITKRTDVPECVVYDYVNDRLRSVRQDVTIQRLPPDECMDLLEPMIRFYVFFGYKLCHLPVSDFNPDLNKKYLLECIKWFLKCCDIVEKDKKCIELSKALCNININSKSKRKLNCDRVLIESLYILCNLNDVNPILRFLNLPKDLKFHSALKLCYSLAIYNFKGNYVKVCKMMEQLCPLSYCAVCLYLPILQRNALRVMSHAYSSKQLSIPATVIRNLLLFNSDSQVITTCHHYGLKTENGNVKFLKTDFKTDTILVTPYKIYKFDQNLDLSLDNIFTYKSI